MEDTKTRLKRLLDSPRLTLDEKRWLLNYLEREDGEDLHQLALDEFTSGPSKSQIGLSPENAEAILSKIHAKIVPPAKRSPIFNHWRIAATIALAICTASLIYLRNIANGTKDQAKNGRVITSLKDIPPGSTKASLTLADGSTIYLDNSKNGKLTQQGSAAVIKTADLLRYDAGADLEGKSLPTYNTVSTPRGGQYQIILPDRTKVWLNAASSLRFPTSFSGEERNVELSGEAYFEVAKDKKKPFKVRVNNTVIEVLGTHFNIMAYQEEKNLKTTLLEGSVKIIRGSEQAILLPGQQARVKNKIKIVADVDTEEAVAWKNGLFQFKEADLETILRQISRWYDVDIQFEGKLPKEKFRAEVSRNVNLSEVLKILEISGVNFTIKEGRKIIVRP